MTLREIEILVRELAMHVDPEPLSRFEELAELFCRDTGMLAPGKDEPMEMPSFVSDEEKRERWKSWMRERFERLHAQCMELLGEESSP